MSPAGAVAAGSGANGMIWRTVTPPGTISVPPGQPPTPVQPPPPPSTSEIWTGIRALVNNNTKKVGDQDVPKDEKLAAQLTDENITKHLQDGAPFKFE